MNRERPVRRALTLAIYGTLCVAASSSVLAQDSTRGAAESDPDSQLLSAIKVTAQKREEQLQDVPISITVVTDQLLKDMGARDIKDLQLLVPGLTVTSTSSEALTTARIRGVGTVGDNTGLESSVGVVIDGVYRARNGVGFGDLGELERIEVLKGPQGTVFGKNTSAGIINVVTKKPGFETEVEAELTAGNYGILGASAAFNSPIGDAAAFRLFATKRERDGYLDIVTGGGPRTSDEDVNQDFYSLRGQLLLQPNQDLEVNVALDYTERDERCCAGVTIFRGPAAGIVDALAGGEGVSPTADPFNRVAYSNRDTRSEIVDRGISVQMDWTTPWFDSAALTSITALRDWQTINGTDLDFSSADIWHRNFGEDDASDAFETFSQELRLTGSTERVDWMAGVYFADEKLVRHTQTVLGSAYEPYLSIALLNNLAAAFPPGLVNTAGAATFLSEATGRPFGTTFVGEASDDRFEQNARSFAVFTNNTFHVTDSLDLIGGFRYTREDKEVDSRFGSQGGNAGCGGALVDPSTAAAALIARGVPAAAVGAVLPTLVGFMCLPWTNPLHIGRETNQQRDESEWSGTFKAAYRWNENVMFYGSAARGYKAGGFNLDRVQSGDGTTSGPAGILPVIDTSFPAEFVNSYEFGTKTTWAGGNLLLNGAIFYQDFSGFQLNSFLGTTFVVRSVPEVISQGAEAEMLWQTPVDGLFLQAGVTYADTRYGPDVLPDAGLFLLPNSRVSFAPFWSSSAAMSYEWPIGGSLLGRFNIGAKYSSDYNTGSDLDPEKEQSSFTVVNARIGLGDQDERWMLELWAQNLTDKDYIQVGFDAPLQAGSWNAFLAAPRTYGATLRMSF